MPQPRTLSWSLLFILAVMIVGVVAGFPNAPIVLLLAFFCFVWAYRYIYTTFYTGIFFMPFLGVMVSVPTGNILFGIRTFAGSIDVSLGEIILFFVLIAWASKVVFLWWRRRDSNWIPQWPLFGNYLFVVASHLASMFSPLLPDPYVVTKFALRPVLFDYLAFVALPANLLKSRRRLVAALGAFSLVGVLAALNGLIAMFFSSDGFIGRAHPMDIFGIAALGENHNELAELLVATAPVTLALSLLAKNPRVQRLCLGATFFQVAIGLMTFTRTVWIVFALQGFFLVWTIWREKFKKHLASVLLGAVLVMPFAIGMVVYTLSATAQSSNSTRLMLTQIAMQVFETSPIFGGGAGSFLDRVGSTNIFLVEYGDPLDSHGFVQKLAAETGLLGLAAMLFFIVMAFRYVRRGIQQVHNPVAYEASILLAASSAGAFVYQLFNTSYWTGMMWLPLGLLVAALSVLGSLPHAILEE